MNRRIIQFTAAIAVFALAVAGIVWAQLVVLIVGSVLAWPRKGVAAAAVEPQLASSPTRSVEPPPASASNAPLPPDVWRAVAGFIPRASGVVALGSTCRAIGGVLPAMIGARRCRTGIIGRTAAPRTVCHRRELLAITTACVPAIAQGSIVATSSADNNIKLWAGGVLLGSSGGSSAAPTCVRTLAGHVSDVRSLSWLGPLESTAGLLASGSWSEIRVWCMHTGACLCVLRDGGMQWVNSLARIPPAPGAAATLLLSGSEDRVVRVWRVARSSAHGPARVERVARLEGHAEMVNAVVPLSRALVASGAHDRTVRLWPIDASALLDSSREESVALKASFVLEGHGAAVRALVALPPAQLASGSADHTIRVWCARTGEFFLFTVTFCANPANDLTCPPSYIIF